MSTAAMIWILSACFLVSVIAVLEFRKSPKRFPWRFPVAVLSLLVSGVLGIFLVASPSRFLDLACPTPASIVAAQCWTRGSILLSEPQVFTRERLVNDRLREERWLIDRLSAVDDLLAKGRFQTFQTATTRGKSLTLTVASSKGNSNSAEALAQENPDAAPGAKAENGPITASVEHSPVSEFRRAETYRAEIRDMLMSTQLDDRHDIKGNTLIRLSFNAAVLAGSPSRTAALIYLEVEPDYANIRYDEIFVEWQGQLQQQIDENLQIMTDALSTGLSSPDSLRSPQLQLFDRYVRKAFVEEVTATASYRRLLLDEWKSADDFANPLRLKWNHGTLKERAKILFDFYLDQYARAQRGREYADYADGIDRQLRTVLRLGDPTDILAALGAIGFCNPASSMPKNTMNRPWDCDPQNPRISPEYFRSVSDGCQKRTIAPGMESKTAVPISTTAAIDVIFNQGATSRTRPASGGPSAPSYLLLDCPWPILEEQLRIIGSIVLLRSIASNVRETRSTREAFLRRVLEHYKMVSNGSQDEACAGNSPRRTGAKPTRHTPQFCSHDVYPTFSSARELRAQIRETVAYFLLWQYTTGANIETVRDRKLARHCDGSNESALEGSNSWYLCRYFRFDEVHCPSVDCRVVISAKSFDAGPCATWQPRSQSAREPNQSDSPICTLRRDLEKQARIYAYTMTPSEIAASELANMDSRAVLGASLGVESPAWNVSADGQSTVNSGSRAAMTPPSLIAFSSPMLAQPEQPGQRTGECKTRPARSGRREGPKTCFGWLMRPPTHSMNWSRSENQRTGAQRYSVAVVLSVPSWWKSLRLTQWTCWVDDQAFFSQSLSQSPIVGCKEREAKRPPSYLVQIPGAVRDISQKLGPQIILPPHIKRRPQTLVAGHAGRLFFEGERLWKAPVVYLGDQPADEISVLPSMQGIVAYFSCVQPPTAFWSKGARPGTETVLANVWTSEGRADPEPISVLTLTKDGKVLACPEDATKSTGVP